MTVTVTISCDRCKRETAIPYYEVMPIDFYVEGGHIGKSTQEIIGRSVKHLCTYCYKEIFPE